MKRRKLEIIKNLAKQIQSNFKNFYLAGGTALYLKHRYRISENLDFFSEKLSSFSILSSKLRKIFSPQKEEKFEDNIDSVINDIKISSIFFLFKDIQPLEIIESMKITSDYDIFLNKIYSAERGIESKDVIDFKKKFPNQSFEIYLGTIFSIDDYSGLDKKNY